MRPHTPQSARGGPGDGEPAGTNSHRRSQTRGSVNGLRGIMPPRRTSPSQSAAAQSSQAVSSYRAASRESSKENMAPPDADGYETQRRRIEELKAEVGTLRYRMSTVEQERAMAALQQEAELREARRKAEDDFKQRQAAEAARAAAGRQLEAVQAELASVRTDEETQQAARERRLRAAEAAARTAQEQLEEEAAAREAASRLHERRAAELQGQLAAAQQRAAEREAAAAEAAAALQQTQTQQAQDEAARGALETEVLRLKAQTGDAATMDIIRRELKDQVAHIRALEATNRDQLAELRQLRQAHKAVEIVEEEKRSLLRRLDSAQQVEHALAEERLQRQRLETERRAWEAYLEGPDHPEFDSPADMAKALMEERYRTAALTERLGAVEPEAAQREADVQALQAQKEELEAELGRVKAAAAAATATATAAVAVGAAPSGHSSDKVRARLERQRALAVKEVEYLRAQLKAFDTEDMTFRPEQFDQQRADRIAELEKLVDEYRAEGARLLEAMAQVQPATASEVPVAAAGTKRPHPEDDHDHDVSSADTPAGQLARKTRKLQDEAAAARTAQRALETELAVAREQLAAAQVAAGVRVLALRDNPTAAHEAVKQATLTALEAENRELLAHIQAHTATENAKPGTVPFTTVPLSVLAAAQREIAAAQADAASAHKAARRLKEVWAAKSAEFKEAVESTLGWHVAFMPNGKMRVESAFAPSATDSHENSIVFDGERGTMKVGGGPRSPFATRIADQIRFWVREKGCIPGFLAALTLEFYEEQARK